MNLIKYRFYKNQFFVEVKIYLSRRKISFIKLILVILS